METDAHLIVTQLKQVGTVQTERCITFILVVYTYLAIQSVEMLIIQTLMLLMQMHFYKEDERRMITRMEISVMMGFTFNLMVVTGTVKRILLTSFVLIQLFQTSILFVLNEFVLEKITNSPMNVLMEMLLQMMDAQIVLLIVGISAMKVTHKQKMFVRKYVGMDLTLKTMNVMMETTIVGMVVLNFVRLNLVGTALEVEESDHLLVLFLVLTFAWNFAETEGILECMNVMMEIMRMETVVMKIAELNGDGNATMEVQFKKIPAMKNVEMDLISSNILVTMEMCSSLMGVMSCVILSLDGPVQVVIIITQTSV